MSLDYSIINCFDLEMCCWEEGETGEILSIGVMSLCLKTGQSLSSAHYYVKPDRDQISDYCQQLTGITPSIIHKHGRPLGDVLKTVQKHFGGAKRFYACWGDDDRYLQRQCSIKGLESPIHRCLNVASLYMFKKRHSGSNIGLKRAMEREGLSFEGQAHNALVDSQNMANLILKAQLI